MQLIYNINGKTELFHWPTKKHDMSYFVYNSKTHKYTGPFVTKDKVMRKLKKIAKDKPMKKIAKEIVKLAKDVKKPRKPAKYVRSPIVQMLIQAREAAGMTRAEIAKSLKRHPAQIHNFENKMKMPRPESLQEYAKALGYDVVMELKPIPGWKPNKR